jgi:hypothetical protein
MEHPILSENEKIAMNIAGESTSRIMTLDGRTADDIIEERNIKHFNDQVDNYKAKLDEHSANLDKYAQTMAENIENIEIMPVGNYVLARQFAENPFQRIVRDPKSGLIIDIGGQPIEYKNTDSGELEQEEQFIKVLIVVEVGPECKWVKPDDIIFATKPSLVPIPFYKQNLQLVNETRVLSVVNNGLKNRFEEVKNELNPDTVNIMELPDFLGETIEERLEGYKSWKKKGFKLVEKCLKD